MNYKPSDSYHAEFTTQAFATGIATDATGTPVATANLNGTDVSGAFTLTVANLDTGRYKITGTVPSTYATGDVVNVTVAATVSGVFGKAVVDAFLVDTERVSDLNDPATATIVDAVWDELTADHTTTGTFGATTGAITGAGATSKTIRITDSDDVAIPDAEVWLTSDIAGTNVVAGAQSTNDDGDVTFYIDLSTTYYVWLDKAGDYAFTNPVNTWTPT